MEALLKIFLLSMAPVGELRLGIPIGIAVLHLNVASVFLVSIAGNLAPALVVLFLLKRFSPYLSAKSKVFAGLLNWWGTGALKRHSGKIQKYGLIGLILLVGVPLPFTGAYTGALLAVLMDLPFKKSVPALFAGVVVSGVIVTLMVIFGINIQEYLWLQILLGLALIFGLIYLYYLYFKKRKRRKANSEHLIK